MSDECTLGGGLAGPQTTDLSNSLLIGIGNDGRSDDGLGWAFLNAVEQHSDFNGTRLYRFQLQIEDAETISHANRVVFVDSCRYTLPNGFQWQNCQPAAEVAYTSHQLNPQTVLFLCQQLYERMPAAHLLLIEGTVWDLEIGLSVAAQTNLESALLFFADQI